MEKLKKSIDVLGAILCFTLFFGATWIASEIIGDTRDLPLICLQLLNPLTLALMAKGR